MATYAIADVLNELIPFLLELTEVYAQPALNLIYRVSQVQQFNKIYEIELYLNIITVSLFLCLL